MGTFPVVDGRQWKGQVPYLARHFRVVTWDPRGNRRSDRPTGPDAYADEVYARAAAAVSDASGTDAAFVVALCPGINRSLLLAAAQPKRVCGLVAIAPGVHPLAPNHPLETVDQARWRGDFTGWIDYHSNVLLPEPHSSKLFEDPVGWSPQTDADVIAARTHAPLRPATEDDAIAMSQALTCPVLVLHGSEDKCRPRERGERFAQLTRGLLVVLDGVGHLPHGRPPVLVTRSSGSSSRCIRLRCHSTARGCSRASESVARCGCARPSGWAMCFVTSPSPGRYASRFPISRSSGWRSRR